MVLLKSETLPASFIAPDFNLQSVEGKGYSLASFSSSRVLVVAFICNHCPYVKAIEDRLIALQREFSAHPVQFVGICSNDPTDYPDDLPHNLLKRWKAKDYGFPYLIDEDQTVAKAYGAVCTPDLYVFNEKRQLQYHGRLDDSWQDPCKVTRRELADAVRQLLAGQSPLPDSQPSMGCSIKWRQR